MLHVVAPVHAAIGNASIEVMINCMLAQTISNWSLTIVGDGPLPRVRSLVANYPRIAYLETNREANDHGHTPRAVGLETLESGFVVLSGIDNYYVPLFVETVLAAVTRDVGMVYWDFLLDMKGEAASGAAYDAALDAYTPSSSEFKIAPILDGQVVELPFDGDDDRLEQRAREFVATHGLTQGGGCDDAGCVVATLVDAMRRRTPLTRPRALKAYTGYIDANLDVMGNVDVGAVAVRTDVAQAVGFRRWRNHAADFHYVRACLAELENRRLQATHLTQTLYVHN